MQIWAVVVRVLDGLYWVLAALAMRPKHGRPPNRRPPIISHPQMRDPPDHIIKRLSFPPPLRCALGIRGHAAACLRPQRQRCAPAPAGRAEPMVHAAAFQDVHLQHDLVDNSPERREAVRPSAAPFCFGDWGERVPTHGNDHSSFVLRSRVRSGEGALRLPSYEWFISLPTPPSLTMPPHALLPSLRFWDVRAPRRTTWTGVYDFSGDSGLYCRLGSLVPPLHRCPSRLLAPHHITARLFAPLPGRGNTYVSSMKLTAPSLSGVGLDTFTLRVGAGPLSHFAALLALSPFTRHARFFPSWFFRPPLSRAAFISRLSMPGPDNDFDVHAHLANSLLIRSLSSPPPRALCQTAYLVHCARGRAACTAPLLRSARLAQDWDSDGGGSHSL